MYNKNRPITPVQYRSILDGHLVGMVRCDWPFTVGYVIIFIMVLIFEISIVKWCYYTTLYSIHFDMLRSKYLIGPNQLFFFFKHLQFTVCP